MGTQSKWVKKEEIGETWGRQENTEKWSNTGKNGDKIKMEKNREK